jgi:hypothetical protein
MFRYGTQNVLKCTRRYAAVLEQSSLYWKITVETVYTRTAALELVRKARRRRIEKQVVMYADPSSGLRC